MITSRGLRPANAALSTTRAHLRSPRHFSTNAPLRTPNRLSRTPLAGVQSPWKTSSLRAAPVAVSASAFRFASTSSQTSPAEAAAASTPPGAATDIPPANLDSLTDRFVPDGFFEDITKVPETIGYLKSLGLDYGWGPTSCLQSLLEHVHVYSGMPWWASIVVSAVIVRLGIFPLYKNASDMTARAQSLKPLTDPVTAAMTNAMRAGNTNEAAHLRNNLQAMNKSAGVSPIKMLMGPVVQGVTGFCSFRLMRAMALLPVPGFETGGFLWVQNLTTPDPYYILPVAFAALVHMVARKGGESGANITMTPLQNQLVLYGMPGLALIFSAPMPGALQIYFFASASIGMTQGLILRNPRVRKYLNITPLPKKVSPKTVHADLAIEGYQAPKSTISSSKRASEASKEAPANKGKIASWYAETKKDIKNGVEEQLSKAGYESRLSGDKNKTKKSSPSEEFKKAAEVYERKRQEEIEAEKANSGRS